MENIIKYIFNRDEMENIIKYIFNSTHKIFDDEQWRI